MVYPPPLKLRRVYAPDMKLIIKTRSLKGGDKVKGKKYIFPAMIAVAAAIAGTLYATGAFASYGDGPDNMASNLASKLGIEESKVTEAMDSIHTERQAERKAEISANLDKAVSAGVLTEEQKDKLVAKQDEMQQKQEALRTEMDQWYSDNGIDRDKLEEYGVRGMGIGMGRGGRGGHGM